MNTASSAKFPTLPLRGRARPLYGEISRINGGLARRISRSPLAREMSRISRSRCKASPELVTTISRRPFVVLQPNFYSRLAPVLTGSTDLAPDQMVDLSSHNTNPPGVFDGEAVPLSDVT